MIRPEDFASYCVKMCDICKDAKKVRYKKQQGLSDEDFVCTQMPRLEAEAEGEASDEDVIVLLDEGGKGDLEDLSKMDVDGPVPKIQTARSFQREQDELPPPQSKRVKSAPAKRNIVDLSNASDTDMGEEDDDELPELPFPVLQSSSHMKPKTLRRSDTETRKALDPVSANVPKQGVTSAFKPLVPSSGEQAVGIVGSSLMLT
jgi:hypothetical protein